MCALAHTRAGTLRGPLAFSAWALQQGNLESFPELPGTWGKGSAGMGGGAGREGRGCGAQRLSENHLP